MKGNFKQIPHVNGLFKLICNPYAIIFSTNIAGMEFKFGIIIYEPYILMGITDFSFFYLFIHLIFAKKVKMGKRVFFFGRMQ